MKIINFCFVTSEYAHKGMGKTGGIGVFIKRNAQYLTQNNFNVYVYTYGGNNKCFDDDGVQIIQIKDFDRLNKKILNYLKSYKIPGYFYVKLFLEYLNRFYLSMRFSLFTFRKNIDIIEFPDYLGCFPFTISKAHKVIRCHGSALALCKFMGYNKRNIDIIFEKLLFKRFSKNSIAVSSHSADITQQSFNLKLKPKVIYNGVSIQEIIKGKEYIKPTTIQKSIFYFGLLTERKGLDIACKVFNDIITEFPSATFHLVGGNINNNWERISRDILSTKALKNTIYYGSIPNDEIFTYLSKAHVVIFPSFGETLSLALLEVLSIGKIAITSNIPAFKEIVESGNNGFIIEKHEDYKLFISKIFNNEVNVEFISENAINTINEKFNTRLIIDENINYYKSLL
ncbi:MAG: glycosyltransferase family 4 protein [Flavobacteriaceae bacterium]|nr:glycosyltransferase family 4 protein [Flavobacteriaceae bacterium]